jgi:hypothetical protein
MDKPLKSANEYRDELRRDYKSQPPDRREELVNATLHFLMIQDRDQRIRELEQRIVDLHHPPALIKAFDERRARVEKDLADPDTLESYRQSAIAAYAASMHPPRLSKDVVLPEGEWPPGYEAAVFARRELGLSDDGETLVLEHESCKDLPRPKIFEITAKRSDNTPVQTEDDISGTFIGSLMKK